MKISLFSQFCFFSINFSTFYRKLTMLFFFLFVYFPIEIRLFKTLLEYISAFFFSSLIFLFCIYINITKYAY
jgi:hypothetical protein